MKDDSTGLASTSTAATTETEPEVIAGIASGDLQPDQPLAIRADRDGFGYGRMLMLLAAGIAVGYAVSRLLRRDD